MSRIEKLIALLPHGSLVDEGYALSFFMQVNGLRDVNEAHEWMLENEERNSSFFAIPDGNGLLQFAAANENDLPPNTIYIMTLNGPVMPESSWGIPGTDLLSAQLDWALNHNSIAAIVFRLETGGGSAYKLWPFVDRLLAAREVKPIVAHIDGLSASAGVAIHTACTESFADHASTDIGSIGACLSFMDMMPMLEDMGCKYHYVNAPQNPDKNKQISDLRKGEYGSSQESLKKLAAEFHSRVKIERKNTPGDALTGKMYSATEAIDLDLIDGLATLEQAVSRAHELAQIHKKATV